MIKIEAENVTDGRNVLAWMTWMTLGDGNITLPKNGTNAYFQVYHRDSSEDYIRLKESLLSTVTSVTVSRYYHSRAEDYFWQLRTQCHPMFTKLRTRVYLDKRKVIQPHAVKLLTPLALAILYQDDGRYNSGGATVSINKPTFSEAELGMLVKGIVDKWGLIFRVRRSCVLKDGTIGHELGLRRKDMLGFFDLIEPYVVPSMLYKIGRGGRAVV